MFLFNIAILPIFEPPHFYGWRTSVKRKIRSYKASALPNPYIPIYIHNSQSVLVTNLTAINSHRYIILVLCFLYHFYITLKLTSLPEQLLQRLHHSPSYNPPHAREKKTRPEAVLRFCNISFFRTVSIFEYKNESTGMEFFLPSFVCGRTGVLCSV